jgi:crotonobetainyl-CoA:carnitine CoA-transferase CaiB-like acyl-CoA transferase
MLAAILAAMRLRDRTGEGQYVEVTLQRTGIWALASDVTTALFQHVQPERTSKKAPANPIWNFYATSDGRHLALVMPAALPYWPKFCTMIGKPEWITDARFQTLVGFAEHGPAIVPEITAMFASHDLEYWRKKLDAAGLIWEPVALLPEVIVDPALREAGAFATIVHPTGGAMEIISAPFHIRDAGIHVRGPAPDVGQHTREVFAEVGVPESTIDDLIAKGVLT